MSDGQLLLFIFALIYVSDAVAWFGEREFLFVSFYGQKLAIRRHRFFFPGFKTGVSFLNPLPFLGQGYVAGMFPFSVSKTGVSPVCIENPNPGYSVSGDSGASHFSWDEIESIDFDLKKLRINKREFRKFSSEHSAKFWCDFLSKLKDEDSDDRRAGIIDDHLMSYVDVRRPKKRLRIFQKGTRYLRIYANMLFFVVFLLVPFTYILFRESKELLHMCLIMWALMIALSVETWCLHRRFFPQAKGERIQHIFLSLFLPNISIRNVDFLSKRFFHDTHPLALGVACADPASFEKFRRALARDIAHPVPFQDSGTRVDIAEEFRDDHYLPLMDETFPELGNLVDPPEPIEDPAFCPRCLTSYESPDVKCKDCGGIPVVKS